MDGAAAMFGPEGPSLFADRLREHRNEAKSQQNQSDRDEWESGGHVFIMPRI
jgi:predicted secreted Zn-dependent protease